MASTALNYVHQHKEEKGNIEDKDLEKRHRARFDMLDPKCVPQCNEGSE